MAVDLGKKYLLMIPGPVQIAPDILEAFNGQTAAHYGPEWTEIYLSTEKMFSKLVNSDGRTFLMPGSGSLGLDTVATTFCRGKKCLILNNGMFGNRLYEIVGRQAGAIKDLQFPLNRPINPDEVEKELAANSYDIVFVPHAETSTGILNPIEKIASVAGKHGVMFFVDAVASAGIEKIDMRNWGIDAVVTGSQKGMETPPGLGIVTINRKMLDYLDTLPENGWYTSLKVWCEYYDKWHDWHPFPVTLPTNTIIALQKSMEKMFQEGVENRQQLYRNASDRFREAVRALGLSPYSQEGDQAHGLTSVSTGGKFDPAELVTYFRMEHNILISGSFGELKKDVFRVGHMSTEQCLEKNLVQVIKGIGQFLVSKGISTDTERAVQIISRG
jgi:alanine-glyoxylate transaminase / serine-glyoxylate transaminase / serine-pyruvate transaminase